MYSPDPIHITLNILNDIPPLTLIEHHTSPNLLLLLIALDHLRPPTHIWLGVLLSYHTGKKGDIPDHL
jgi:hypothetical protein